MKHVQRMEDQRAIKLTVHYKLFRKRSVGRPSYNNIGLQEQGIIHGVKEMRRIALFNHLYLISNKNPKMPLYYTYIRVKFFVIVIVNYRRN